MSLDQNLMDARVAMVRQSPEYAVVPPYEADEDYPEWPGREPGREFNPAYRGVRAALAELKLDEQRFGTPAWNPLGGLVAPGGCVMLKPNLVNHRNTGDRLYGLTDTSSLITHGSVIRAVMDYAALALHGHGKIIVSDCPIQGADWQAVLSLAGLPACAARLRVLFPGLTIEFNDNRLVTAEMRATRMLGQADQRDENDGYELIDLGDRSLLLPLMRPGVEFGVAQYPRWRMRSAHSPHKNLYLFHRDYLYPDLLINLPKLKTHMKAGFTGGLKNLVGMVGHKDYLPHFRYGSPHSGGDEYPDGTWLWNLYWQAVHWDWELKRGSQKQAVQFLVKVLRACQRVLGAPDDFDTIGGGGWSGNDTLWRTILDVNRAFFYFNRENRQIEDHVTWRGNYLAVMDGLIGGHRESPLSPTPVEAGVILAAQNPVALDAAAVTLIGYDLQKLPQLREAFRPMPLSLVNFLPSDVRLMGLGSIKTLDDLSRSGLVQKFEPSQGYRGSLERVKA